MDSLLEESTNVSLGSVANVSGRSNNGQIGLKFKASNRQDDVIQVDDSDDEDSMMGTLKTEPTDDAIEGGSGAPSNVNPYEIGSGTIITQNTSDALNSNVG